MKRRTAITIALVSITTLALYGCTRPTPTVSPVTTADTVPTQTRPLTPVNIAAEATSQSTATVRWLDNSDNEEGFRVYRGTALVGTVEASGQVYRDTGLKEGTTYQYAVKAFNQTGESPAATCSVTTLARPSAPGNLQTTSTSQTTVVLRWTDNSGNEQGFRVYRDGTLAGTVAANAQTYDDGNLLPATVYQYAVRAYNQVGESQASTLSVKTTNPGIRIRLDRIGVHENREPSLRGKGDVYVLVGIVDGTKSTQLKLPAGDGVTYSLDKNETVSVGGTIYSTEEVGDVLTISFLGYESDGGGFEQLAYQGLGMALDAFVPGASVLAMFGVNIGSLIGSLLGQEDDWLGSYELHCSRQNGWGVGQYADVVLKDERGVDCLRLWFTIETEPDTRMLTEPTPPVVVKETPPTPAPVISVVSEVGMLVAKTTVGVDVTTTQNAGRRVPAVISVGHYAANPQAETPEPALQGGFYDVYVEEATAGDTASVLIKFYNANVTENTTVYVWSELRGAWAVCEPVSATAAATQGINMFSGYAWVRVTDATIPAISDLDGTPFALLEPVAEPEPDPTPPAAPAILTPTFGDEAASIKPTFTWTASEGATSYEFVLAEEIGQDDKFAIIDYSATTATHGHVAREQLKYSTVYNWRVRAVNDIGKSDWTTGFFTTEAEPEP